MNSTDIYARIKQLIRDQMGGIIPMLPPQKEEYAKMYQRALFDYCLEKLFQTEENQVIVEDLGFIFERLDKQLTAEEHNPFYANIVHSIIYAYNDLTDDIILWEIVDDKEQGDFPRITGEYTKFMQTKKSSDNKEVALWLYKQYEGKIEKRKQYQKQNNRQGN